MLRIKKTIQRISLLILTAILVLSCGIGNETKGPQIVSDNYDTKTKRVVKTISKDGQEAVKALYLHVSGSGILDSLQSNLACSNIAVMTYGALSPKERKEYDQLFVVLENESSQRENTYQYLMEALVVPSEQRELFVSFSQKLMQADYEGIVKEILPKYQTPTLAAELGNFMRPLIETHGKLTDYKATQFGLATMTNGTQLYKFEGVLLFKDGYVRPYFITAPMNETSKFISGYQLDI